ncbi:MAG: tRNA (adenosine(37)-N6)-threonylcarbamoyltransferase complex ATPase subunit type 1 TsaE, partial [Alphaproteobacteria bacterium]|nr:tRNA (adenosine(37)-N6)-threonylcarbamoyltransferase complex ATPase subunit type 1 TsaE [Alphaproteobacteria bacterium]
ITGIFIQHLKPPLESASSTTYTIIPTYNSLSGEIWHADCYRLKSEEEFYELGLDEAFSNCITIIEWPEIISDFLPANTIHIFFEDYGNYKKIATSKF